MFGALTSEPYPGLRPFDSEEVDIFFGREHQTDELLARLQKRRFLAVVGPSGCGKSSLVRAGMIPALQSGFMIDTGSTWRVVTMRPGERPLLNLANALLDSGLLDETRGGGSEPALYLKAALKRGPLSLVEMARETGLCRNANLLLLVDQFEELFRFRRPGTLDEAEAFVALLLATANQRELPIYVVITMRSDFLGECPLFHGLPETINDAQYLTPRLTREECAAAITGPAKVFGGSVDPALVNRLLNDVGPDPDQLPLLQHSLMRMWERRSADCVLTSEDYQQIGGMKEALSRHGDQILAGLSDEQRRIAEIMFRRLVDLRSGRRDTRTSARVCDVADIAGVAASDVIPVVEVFRARSCSFLTPREGELECETLLDIGHESLIRKWQKFSRWVEDEAEAVSTYRRLRETALLWKRGKAGLWGTPDLDLALAWKQRVQPTEAWAARYGELGDLPIALEFLEASAARKRSEQQERARRLRRAIRWAQVSASVAALLIGSWLAYLSLYRWEHAQYFTNYEKVDGSPVGVGKLTRDDVAHRQSSFRIVRQGRLGHVVRMEAVTARLKESYWHGVGTYLEPASTDWLREPHEVVAWEYAYQESSNAQSGRREQVISETAYDSHDQQRRNVVWRFVFMPEDDVLGKKRVRSGYFVGRNGLPRARGREQRTIVEIHYDEIGRQERVLYRNRAMRPARGLDQAYGKQYRYDERNPLQLREIVSLGPDAATAMIDEFGNAVFRISSFDKFGNTLEAELLDPRGQLIEVPRDKGGWAIFRTRSDRYGRIVEESYFDAADRPILHGVQRYHRLQRDFDARGNTSREAFSDAAGQPVADAYHCHAYAFKHDDRDRQVERTCIGPDGLPAPLRDHYATEKLRYDEHDFLIEAAYFDPRGKPAYYTGGEPGTDSRELNDGYATVRYERDELGRLVTMDLLGANRQLIAARQGYARMKTLYDLSGNAASKAFFDVNLEPTPAVGYGYAKWHQEYDPYGNILRTRYFAADGTRTLASERNDPVSSGWIATYDANGNKVDHVFVDEHDEPLLGEDGRAGYREDFDNNDNVIMSTSMGRHREPVQATNSVGQILIFYDQLARQTAKKFRDERGRAMLDPGVGAYGWRQVFDHQGRTTELSYLDQHDRPMISTASGYATVRYEYAGNSQRISRELYFNERNERMVVTTMGSSGFQHFYDDRGNETELRNLDARDSPLERSEYIAGRQQTTYAIARTAFDNRGNAVEQAYYSKDDKLTMHPTMHCARLQWSYDRSGRLESESCFGADNEPIVRAAPGGYKKVIYKYDERGDAVEQRYVGPGNEPARLWENIVADGQHLTRNEFDRFGDLVEQTFFDESGRRVFGYSPHGDRCFRWTARYNHAGQSTSPTGECHQQ